MDKIVISMPLLSHIPKTDNKKAPNKFFKINNQAIYNGSLNKFARAIVTENMHNYVINSIPEEYLNLKIEKTQLVEYKFYTVRNHGDISKRGGKRIWKAPKADYKPDWDLNNISDIWQKTGNDALVLAGVLTDDNVGVIRKTSYEFIEVAHIDDLELEIIITL